MMEVPADFAAVLEDDKVALNFLHNLSRSDRYSVPWRIQTATPTARAGRMQAMLELLSKRKVPRQLGGSKCAKAAIKKRSDSAEIDSVPEAKRVKETAPIASNAAATRRSSRVAKNKN
jgi:hypothetical protein